MSTKIEVWTQQSKKVKDLLVEQQRLTVKRSYIEQKYGSEAKIFLKAYDFFVKEAKKIVEKPEDAEYQEDLKNHKETLKKYGINDDSEIILSPHYPVLKNKIKQSWKKLYEGKNNGFNSKKKGAAIWELRSEWIKEFVESN
jgi:hypothetical protein